MTSPPQRSPTNEPIPRILRVGGKKVQMSSSFPTSSSPAQNTTRDHPKHMLSSGSPSQHHKNAVLSTSHHELIHQNGVSSRHENQPCPDASIKPTAPEHSQQKNDVSVHMQETKTLTLTAERSNSSPSSLLQIDSATTDPQVFSQSSGESITKTVPLHSLLQSRSQLQHEKTKELTDEQKSMIGVTLRDNDPNWYRKKRKRKRVHINASRHKSDSSSCTEANAEDLPDTKRKSLRRSSASSEKMIGILFMEIPSEVWTLILLHIAPLGSYTNLCLVNRHFYKSVKFNDLYWHHQCVQCLGLLKRTPQETGSLSSDGESSNPDVPNNGTNSNPEKGKRPRPKRTSQQDDGTNTTPPSEQNSSVQIESPINLSWYETYKREHLRLLKQPTDDNWLNLANNLADRQLFFYALHAYNKAHQQNPSDAFTTACIGDLFYKNYLHRSSFDYLHAAISKQGLSAEQAPWAYRQLSHLYRDALGAPTKDINKSIALLKSSIEQTNDVDAMYELGDLYDELRLKAASGAKRLQIHYDASSEDTSSTDSNNGSPRSGGSSSGKSSNSGNISAGSHESGSAPSMNSEQSDATSQSASESIPQTDLISLAIEPNSSTGPPPEHNTSSLHKKTSIITILNGGTSSSSDSQGHPKPRIRTRDRFRSVPLHSSRFNLRDDSALSSECTSSESPESEMGQGSNSKNRNSSSGSTDKFFKMALHWFEMAASYGDIESMFELANMYPDSSPQRAAWLKKAADMGHKDALNDLAVMYELGQGGVQKDLKKAFQYYLASASAGSVDGMTNAGLMYEFGKGIQRDYRKSIEMYMEAAKNGSARAMKNIGVMYELSRGVQRNYEKAVEWYQKAAEQSDTDAMLYLGTMAASGRGMPKNFRTSLKYFRTVLNEHQDTAVYPYLAYMYIYGLGTKKNVAKGLKYLHTSAYDNEDATGQYMLGEVFHLGIDGHLEPNQGKALELLEKSAKQEDHDATLHLSYFFAMGIAVAQNEAKAERIFVQVVEEIGIERCLEMADDIFSGGHFYTKNVEYATYIWSSLAKTTKNRTAMERLKGLDALMKGNE